MEFKKKILAVFILGLALIGTVGGVMVLYSGNKTVDQINTRMQPVVEEQAKEAVQAKAEALANEFEAFFNEVEALGKVTQELAVVSLDDLKSEGVEFGSPGYADVLKEIINERFAVIAKAESKISSVYFGDVNGNMFIYPEQELPEGYDPRVRPWYQEAVQANGPVWSEPYQDAVTGKWVVTYAIPVYYNGKLVGVVGLDVFIDTLTEKIDKVKIGKTGYAFVIGPDGMTYMHPDHSNIMKVNVFNVEALKPIADVVRSGKDEGVVVYTWQGVTSVAAGVKIPSTGWYVFARVPEQEMSAGTLEVVRTLEKDVRSWTIKASIIIGILVISMILVIYKLLSDAIKPLETLRDVAQALADGRLSEVRKKLQQIHYLEDDEIGALIKAFEAVGKDLVGTLHAIASKLERLAEGDLSNGLSVEAKGELREIIEDVKNMNAKMKALIGNIIDLTEKVEKQANILAQIASDVTEAINQVNEAVQQVSVEAQRQQENINEITEGMRLVAETSEESVRAMEEFEGAVNEVIHIAEDGKQKGEISARQIESIQEMMREIEQAVSKVNEMSRSIEEITNVITGMAEQTNLLALNAAIEAARAGDAGRGFAVVAQEIRNLAEESKKAADNIKNIINKMTEEIKNAVEATRRGVSVVSESSETLRETTEYLTNIAELISDTGSRLSHVKEQILRTQEEVEKALKALENLAASAEETTASAEEVSSAVEEQTAAIEELKRAAEELRKLVEALKKETSSFKL